MSEGEFEGLQRLLARRHSCRAFLPDPVPHGVIEKVLETAQRTASWCNAQPWSVHIVSGEPLERLRKDLLERSDRGLPPAPELDWPSEYRGAYRERRRACGWALYSAVGVEIGDHAGSMLQARENFRLFGAPHLAIVTSDRSLGTHGVVDCGAWMSNFMLAATAAGVATIAQAALASWPDVLRAHLPIPEDRVIVCGVSFGRADTSHPANSFRTTRASADEYVSWVG